MTENVRVRYTNSDGDTQPVTITVVDTDHNGRIDEAEIRAQAEQLVGDKLRQAYTDGRINRLPGHIDLSSYEVDTNLADTAITYSPRRTFSGPFGFNINNLPGRSSASVVGETGPLQNLSYTSDGQTGLAPSEARGVIERLFENYGVRYADYLADPSVLDRTDRSRELRTLIGRDPRVSMGSDGNASLKLSDVLASARTAPTPAAPGANPTDPNAPPASDPSITDFLANPTPENGSRLRADRARTDELINILLAALAAGNTDVLKSAMALVNKNSRNTVAQNAMSTIAALRGVDAQIGALNQQIERLSGRMGANATAADRQAASSEFSSLQVRLNALNSSRQSIVTTLEGTMRSLEEITSSERRLADAYDGAVRPGWRA